MHLAGLLSAYFALPTNGTAGFVRHFVELEQAGDEQVSNEASKDEARRQDENSKTWRAGRAGQLLVFSTLLRTHYEFVCTCTLRTTS